MQKEIKMDTNKEKEEHVQKAWVTVTADWGRAIDGAQIANNGVSSGDQGPTDRIK
jgi:hypothetical protein